MKRFIQRLFLISVVTVLSAVGLYSQVSIGATNYSTLKAAFDGINAGNHTGTVTIMINANVVETESAVLNASGVGSASYAAVNIYTSGAYTVSGTLRALVELCDADNVTIDGRINQAGNVNSLTFKNDSSANSVVIWVDSLAAAGGNGAKNVKLRYLNIIGGSATTSTCYGILSSASSTSSFTTAGAGNDNLQITYCNISKAYYGIRTIAPSTTGKEQKGLVIRYNKFGANATPLMGHYYATYIGYALNPSIRDNYFSVNQASATYFSYLTNCNNANVANNIIENSTNTSTFYGVYTDYCKNTNITNNTFQNNNSPGTVYAFYPYYGTTTNVSNNLIQNNTTTGSFYGVYTYYTYLPTITNNTMLNNTVSTFYGVNAYYYAKFANITDNIVRGVNATSTVYGVYLTSGDSANVLFNTVDNVKNTSGNFFGVYVITSNASKISNNTITNVDAWGDTYGMQLSSVSNSRVENNVVGNITQAYVATNYYMYGIQIASGNNDTLINNSVFYLRGASTNTTTAYTCGIRLAGGTGHGIWHNSVSLTGTHLNTSNALSAAFIATATSITGLNIKNNVFSNTWTAGPTAKAYSIYLAGTGNLTSSEFNYNNYYVGGPNAMFGYLGADAADLYAWQGLAAGQDMNSSSVIPLFNGASNLRPFIGSPLVGAGMPFAALVEYDQDGIQRNPMTPTIGAYEEVGDFAAPDITLTPLSNTILSTTTRSLSATIVDGSGVNTTTNAPRVYYKKSSNANTFVDNTNATNGWKYSVATGTAPNFTFDISHAQIFGGVAVNDTIQYFVVAQDNYTTPLVAVAGASFEFIPASTELAATDFPTSSISRFYRILPSFSGTIDVGVGQTYTTLTDSTGLFRAMNNAVIDGNVTIRIVSDITEQGHFGLNEIPSVGGNYLISIRPFGAPRTLTFNKTGSALLFNQTDRLTLDGRLAGFPGNSLTVRNLNTGATNIIHIGGSSTNGALNVTIRNINIVHGSNSNTASYGILVGDNVSATTGNANNSNISLLFNDIQRVYYGIRVNGASPGITGLTIQSNTIGSDVDSMTVMFKGIHLQDCQAPQILYNTIRNIKTSTSVNNAAIDFATGTFNNANIIGNIISGVYSLSSSGYGAYGINFATSTTFNTYIANNLISDIYTMNYSASSTIYNGFGIRVVGGIGYKVYNNTINLAGTMANVGSNASMNACVLVTGTTVDSVYFVNNILVNTTTHNIANSQSFIYWLPSSTWTGAKYVDYNHYHIGGNYPKFAMRGTAVMTFADWQAAVPFDSNSTSGPVSFISPKVAYISGASVGDPKLIKPLNPLGPVDDINGEVRTTNNNYAGGDIAEPLSLYIAEDLPSSLLRGSDPFSLQFLPQIGSDFADGITRNIIPGDALGMEYTWYRNNIPLQTGVGGVDIDRNNLLFNAPQPVQSGNYYATVSIMGLTAQTGVCALLIDPLMPNLIAPENLSMDQDKNVQFEWTAPTNATSFQIQVSLMPNFVTNTIDTVLTSSTYIPWNLEYSTTYYWRVRGQNAVNTSNWSEIRSFTTRPAIYPVVLKTPLDAATFVEAQNEFAWKENVDASSYRIQISTDITFTTFHTNTVTIDTLFIPTTPLNFVTTYYWRVQGLNSPYESEWSEVRSITTRPAIYKPVLVYPANNKTNIPTNLSLRWRVANGATSYRVQMSLDSNFATYITNQVVTDTLHSLVDLLGETNYYWRIQGINATHTSEWSDAWKFQTKKLFWRFANDTVTIGTGTTTVSYPFYTVYEDSRMQTIWTASEIMAAGGIYGAITSIAFNVSTFNTRVMNGYTIRMQNTSLTSLSGYVHSGWTTVYTSNTESVTATGWRFTALQNPFNWNGTSNLLIDICFDNDGWSGSSAVFATSTTDNLVYHRYHDSYAPGCSTTETTPNSSLSSQTVRPNIKLAAFRNEPDIATLVAPANNAANQPIALNLSWLPMDDASSYRVQVATDASFNTLVYNQVTTSTSVALSNLDYATQYFWRVKGINIYEESLWSLVHNFTTRVAIYPVVLVSPLNSTPFLSMNQTLIWRTNVDATLYNLQVSTSPTFATTLTDISITDTTYTLLLPPNVNIYWRVRGLSLAYEGEWSAVWSFSTIPNIYPPSLVSPANTMSDVFQNLRLVWNPISNATNYTIQVATNLGFTNIVSTNTTADTSYQVWGLDGGTTHYWRVKSFNTTDTSEWSDIWAFTTVSFISEYVAGDTNSTSTNYYHPIARYWNHSVSETIYTAEELGFLPKVLKSLAYYKVSGTNVLPITGVSIYMKHVTDSVVVANTYDLSTYQLVWTGDFTNDQQSGWMKVVFNTDFNYNGTDNLNILVLKAHQSYISSPAYPIYRVNTKSVDRTAYRVIDGTVMPTATNTVLMQAANIKFDYISSPLSSPELMVPANNSVNRPLTQNIVWNVVSGAVYYKVQVSTNPNFTTLMVDNLQPATNYVLTNLENGTKYYWRVKALDDTTVSMWSEAWSFTTFYPNVTMPIQMLPANNAMHTEFSPTIEWEPALNATNYHLMLSDDSTFTTTVFDGYIGETIKSNLILTPSTTYYWKVRSMNPSDTSAWTSMWNFTTQPLLLPPTKIAPLDSAMGISVVADLSWQAYPTATKYVVQVSNDATSFASPLFQDTTVNTSVTTSLLNGATEYFWRVRSFRNDEWSAWSTITMFTTGAGAVTQTFTLVNGWNMISANIIPGSTDMDDILSPLAGNLQQAKNVYGAIFAPPFTNTLTNWNKYHAYQVRLTTAAQLQMQGVQIDPVATPITLDQFGWYWFPYYRTTAMPVATALASISGKYLQVKTITGQVYQPPFATTLANLEPNLGYMIRLVANDGVLTYPANTIIKQSDNSTVIEEPKVFVRDAHVTGKTAFIALDLNANVGDEVGVFTRDGLLVGSSVYQNGLRGVVVWGDDEFTSDKDGAFEGEELTVKVWSKSTKNIGDIEQIVLNDMTTNAKQYTLRYETDGVYFLKANVEAGISGVTITPQPANTEVFIHLNATTENGVDITLYNQAGQVMLNANEAATNGVIKLNTSNLPSGVYQAMINIDGRVVTERIVIVK